MSQRRKVTVVGAGNVGATCAQVLATRDYADVVLVDIKEGLPQGKALDINQMGAVLGYEPNVTGSNGYEETAGSAVVVITAGLPRSPGMSRDDLVSTNEKIVKDVTEKVTAQSPDAILIVVSNPLDAMCHVAKNVSGWPKRARRSAWRASSTRHGSRPSSPGRPASSVKDVQRGRARRPRRPDGAGRLGHHRRRRAAAQARRRGQDPGDGRAHREGRRRARQPDGHLGLVRAGRGGGADGRLDHARREARAPVHGVPRGRVRHRRPLHGRAGEARPAGDRADRRARPHRRRAGRARERPRPPCARSSACSRT